MVTAMGAIAVWLYAQQLPLFVSVLVWPVYWFAQVRPHSWSVRACSCARSCAPPHPACNLLSDSPCVRMADAASRPAHCSLRNLTMLLSCPARCHQGTVMTGIWIIAHECGHQAFSPSRALNNAVGLVLHSALLVPFHSWRITHANHHKYTCSVEDDEVS